MIAMRLAIVNYAWDPFARTPAELIARSTALAGWADALVGAGCDPVVVCQRFSSRADIRQGGVTYRFRPDGGKPQPGLRFRAANPVHGSVVAARPDIVHVHGALHPELVRSLRGRLPGRTAIVVQDHADVDLQRLSDASRTAVRRGLAATDALLVSSHGRAAEWRDSHAAPNGLMIGDVMDASASMAPIPRDAAQVRSGIEGSPALLWVGPLDADRDPLTVLRGFALFAGRYPTAQLTLVYDEGDLDRAARGSAGVLQCGRFLRHRRPHRPYAHDSARRHGLRRGPRGQRHPVVPRAHRERTHRSALETRAAERVCRRAVARGREAARLRARRHARSLRGLLQLAGDRVEGRVALR
jgi:hypothetical protein